MDMILYNQEHYIDPTAGTAICHVMAEEIRKKHMERAAGRKCTRNQADRSPRRNKVKHHGCSSGENG